MGGIRIQIQNEIHFEIFVTKVRLVNCVWTTIKMIWDVDIALSKQSGSENKHRCTFVTNKTETSFGKYQVTSLLRPCIAENHSDYPPVLMAIIEIIPNNRHDHVTALAATQRISPKHPSTLRQIGRFANFANN